MLAIFGCICRNFTWNNSFYMSIVLGDIISFEHANGSAFNAIEYGVSFLPDTKSEGALEEYVKIRANFYSMCLDMREVAEEQMAKIESWREKYEFLWDFVIKVNKGV